MVGVSQLCRYFFTSENEKIKNENEVGLPHNLIYLPSYAGARYAIGRSHILLVDCLPASERSVRLPDDIEDIVNAKTITEQVKVHRAICGSSEELKLKLESLHHNLKSNPIGSGLIIQLEAHGSDFKDDPFSVGIEIGDEKEFLYWRDLQPYFSNLYDVTRGNLLLNISACWGYSGLATVEGSLANGCAPFRYLLSPTTSITTGELHQFWIQFYKSIYNDLDLATCLNQDERFYLLSIEQFLSQYVLVDGNEITDKEAQIQILKGSKMYITQEQIASDRENHARKIVREYLLLDKYPNLYSDIDLRSVATKLNDHEMLLATGDNTWSRPSP